MKKNGKNICMILTGMALGASLTGGAVASGLIANPTWNPIFVDGVQAEMEAYRIGGNNYVKLRDIGEKVDFNVYWDGGVQVDSDAPYTGENPEEEKAVIENEPIAEPIEEDPAQIDDVDSLKDSIIRHTNALRKEQGLPEVSADRMLTRAAQVRAEEMAATSTYSHVRPDGRDNDTLTDCPYVPENIHRIADWYLADRGGDLGSVLIDDWAESDGHRDIMLTDGLEHIGVGLARGTNHDGVPSWYCVQLFSYNGYRVTWVDSPAIN